MNRRRPLFWLALALVVWPGLGLNNGIKAQTSPGGEIGSSDSSEAQAGSAHTPEEDAGEADLGDGSEMPKGLPFALKSPTPREVTQGRRRFVRALNELSQRNPQKAVQALVGFQPTERLAQVYRAFLLARAFQEAKRPEAADSVYASALRWVGSLTWRNELVRHRLAGFARLQSSDSQKREFYTQVVASDAAKDVKADVLHAWLRLDGFNGHLAPHLDRLRTLMIYARGDRRLDSVYNQAYASGAPGTRSWDEEWMLLQMEARLGAFPKALARCELLLSRVPGKPEKQKLHWQFATLLYAKRDWARALEMYQKYLERYGDSPEAYLQVARSQDKLGQTQRSQLTYDRFLELYPRHAKTSEIHWLRAWEREADGRYAEAIELYYLQLSRFAHTRRADWANFRIGLCLFKDSNFAAAADAFASYRKEKSGAIKPAGMLWEAKMLYRLQQNHIADSLLLSVYLDYPFGFYGHMARQRLEANHPLPDSLQPWQRFRPSRPERIMAWMQDKVPGYKPVLDKTYESAYFDLSQLLEWGLDTLALLTMRSTPAKVKTNPWYLFVHARRFEHYDMHPEAYRLGRALAQVIPAAELGTAPREVLRLIWPRPYESEVQRYALRRKLDPALLYALMRQESGFDREIRSSAGAVGLMQLMPATAKTQAEQDSLKDFHTQDLVQPDINVRLGTFYARNLLDDFQGNPFFMLANYNAGPGPAKRWYKAFGHRPVDEMVEDISYWETRDYVKKVMGNYWTYKILYNNRLPMRPADQGMR